MSRALLYLVLVVLVVVLIRIVQYCAGKLRAEPTLAVPGTVTSRMAAQIETSLPELTSQWEGTWEVWSVSNLGGKRGTRVKLRQEEAERILDIPLGDPYYHPDPELRGLRPSDRIQIAPVGSDRALEIADQLARQGITHIYTDIFLTASLIGR